MTIEFQNNGSYTNISQPDANRASIALAAAKNAACEARDNKEMTMSRIIHQLERFNDDDDFVWMAWVNDMPETSHYMDAYKFTTLISDIKSNGITSSSWERALPNQPNHAKFERIQEVVDRVVGELKATNEPFVIAAGFPIQPKTCFHFNHFERDEAFTLLTDTIASAIMAVSKWLQESSIRRYYLKTTDAIVG